MAKSTESYGFEIDTEINKWGDLELWKYTLTFPPSIEIGSFKSKEDARQDAVKYAIEIFSGILKDLDPNISSEIIKDLKLAWEDEDNYDIPTKEDINKRKRMLAYLGVNNESH